jgi:dihydropteroate synthase
VAILPILTRPRRELGGRVFDFDRQVAVMAIVNRTPDSFFDAGRTYELAKAAAAVEAAADAGADLVDIGGVPFGTAGQPVSEEEELDRVVPLVEAVRAGSDVVISVDTYRASVARESIAAGANLINDTSGLYDPGLADLVAGSDAWLVITHSLASPPRTPVHRPTYHDVTSDVATFLTERVRVALDHGVPPERLVVDPGHDLNKNTRDSLVLTRRLSEITRLGYPTLAAVSNKDFIGETLDAPQGRRQDGTTAAVVYCILQGARIIRVHDVPAGVAAARMTEAILGWRTPAFEHHNL